MSTSRASALRKRASDFTLFVKCDYDGNDVIEAKNVIENNSKLFSILNF